MKASELRIGNFIHNVMDEILEITWIEKGQIRHKPIGLSSTSHRYNQIKSIPITEEWLARLGISDGIFTANEYFSVWRSNVDKTDWMLCFEDNSTGEYIRYVHQLQNLYFAITKEELTLKTSF